MLVFLQNIFIDLPGTNRPQICIDGNTDHGIVYIQITTMNRIALPLVSFPSNGLAMTLYLKMK